MTSALANPLELGYGSHGVSDTIQMNDDLAYVVHMRAGDRLEASLRETTGKRVDFYLTNLTAYMAFKASLSGNQEVEYLYFLWEGTSKDTTLVEYEYTSFIENTLVVVVDNSPWTEDGAIPSGSVSVEGSITLHKNVWTLQNIIITVLVIAVIIAFMVGFWLPRRKID
jgi:hypothetical protein